MSLIKPLLGLQRLELRSASLIGLWPDLISLNYVVTLLSWSNDQTVSYREAGLTAGSTKSYDCIGYAATSPYRLLLLLPTDRLRIKRIQFICLENGVSFFHRDYALCI